MFFLFLTRCLSLSLLCLILSLSDSFSLTLLGSDQAWGGSTVAAGHHGRPEKLHRSTLQYGPPLPAEGLLYLTPFFCDRPPFGICPILPRPDRVPTGRPSVQTRHAKHRYGSILRPDHRARPPGCPQSEGAIPARAWSIWPHFCRRSTRMARTPEPLSPEFLTSVHGPMLENHPSWW